MQIMQKCGREMSNRPLFVLLKSFEWSKCNCYTAQFQYILITRNLPYTEKKLYKILDYWSSKYVLNFKFSGNSFFTTFSEIFFKENISHVMFY